MNCLMNIGEAAVYLRVSKSFLYRLTARGAIRHFRVGGAVRFNQEQLDEWLAGHEVQPVGHSPRALRVLAS